MGRRYPSYEGKSALFIHPVVALPLVAASVVAAIAIFFALCASHSRKLSCLSSKSNNSIKNASVGGRSPPSTTLTCTQEEEEEEEEEEKGQHQQGQRYSSIIYKESSDTLTSATTPDQIGRVMTPRRRLSMSLSMKLPNRLRKIRASRKERTEKLGEESIWTKAIILGERCKIPSDDEEDEAVAFYDEMGHRHRNYRPRTPRSLPVSRTNSFINIEVDHP